jgi:hypothetical protein
MRVMRARNGEGERCTTDTVQHSESGSQKWVLAWLVWTQSDMIGGEHESRGEFAYHGFWNAGSAMREAKVLGNDWLARLGAYGWLLSWKGEVWWKWDSRSNTILAIMSWTLRIGEDTIDSQVRGEFALESGTILLQKTSVPQSWDLDPESGKDFATCNGRKGSDWMAGPVGKVQEGSRRFAAWGWELELLCDRSWYPKLVKTSLIQGRHIIWTNCTGVIG